MNMKTTVLLTAALFAGVCPALGAQQLPKSGRISFHTGFKAEGHPSTVADKHVQGHGTAIGVTFNDGGAGSLHGGPATCFFTFFVIDGHGKSKGFCAFGDADGDRIFTDWHGREFPGGGEGINEIAGGTGKYAGIQGRGPWNCKFIGANGELHCSQHFDYRLP
ncbi:MAG TPA: hypothetical protein VNM24_03705 [Burkholderiales bacterium]|jgi:hypothetical protein|nr:hypothetical protein [Burkholderiales bacterium]